MKKYKPSYLGKLMPVDDKDLMNDFIVNKYEAFTEIYDACKDSSEDISNMIVIESEQKKCLKVKLFCEETTLEKIKSSKKKIQLIEDIISAGY